MGFYWLTPDAQAFLFAFNHYLGPFFPAIVVFIIMIAVTDSRRDYFKLQLLYLMRMFALMATAIFIHFNIKLWAPIINPLRYDHIYHDMDVSASWLIDLIDIFHQLIPVNLMGISHSYHMLFVGMFVLSFCLHGIKGKASSERLMTATILLLILGALSYVVAPAFGPFIFEPSPLPEARLSQDVMMGFHRLFIESQGAYYDPTYFVAGVAMPSLHAANVIVFCLCAERDLRWLLFLYVPITFYILVEAVALRWHYAIDLAFGILIGWLCYRLADWMADCPRANRPKRLLDQFKGAIT
jgi:hypothetical protein